MTDFGKMSTEDVVALMESRMDQNVAAACDWMSAQGAMMIVSLSNDYCRRSESDDPLDQVKNNLAYIGLIHVARAVLIKTTEEERDAEQN